MVANNYVCIQNILMLVVIVTALLFNVVPDYRILLGAIAIICGVGSTLLYFRRHWSQF
jgi:hypothetical protein